MTTPASRFALASSLPAFLVGLAPAHAEQASLPASADVASALTFRDYFNCRSDNEGNEIAQSHCTTVRRPSKITFEQLLCVIYGADAERNPIARCVFKGQKRIYPNPLGYILEERRDGKVDATPQESYPPQTYGDGAIDLIYNKGDWLSIPEPRISFE